jgi:homoserine kinase type II
VPPSGELAALEADGIPVCRPLLARDGDPVFEHGERGYCVLTWIHGSHPTGPELTLEEAHELGATVALIHNSLQRCTTTADLPPVGTAPASRADHPEAAISEANRYQAAARVSNRGAFDQRVLDLLDRRKILIDKHMSEEPDGGIPRGPYGWTHGDLQHRNILWNGRRIAAIIDWDRIRVRPYAEEIARTATIQFAHGDRIDLGRVSAFVVGYRTVIPISVDDLADGVHRLWWKRLNDFWRLDFHYDRNNHSCDDLFLAGETILDWWTTHRDDVQRAFAASSMRP